MDFRLSAIETLRQEPTALAENFFCSKNMNYIQKQAHTAIKNETGMAIDRQNDDDLMTIMRQIYITNVYNPYKNIQEQITFLNSRVINFVVHQIRVGLAERIAYLRDISRPIQPNQLPVSTTTYGNKMPYNNKIGL